MPFRCARGTFTHNEEPTLDELLVEPAVRLLMARDRVDEAEFRRLAASTRERGEKHRREHAPERMPSL
jgi:hypothetical protein